MKLFNLFRTHINKTAETMKTVTLFQVSRRDEEGMLRNLSGDYVPLYRMEPVFTSGMKGDTDNILANSFKFFNGIDESTSMLNYSMTVGDVVCIDSAFYRCIPQGWSYMGGDLDIGGAI